MWFILIHFLFLFVFDFMCVLIRIAWRPSVGKVLSSWHFGCAGLLYSISLFVFLSHLVSVAGYGFRLHRKLTIALNIGAKLNIFLFRPRSRIRWPFIRIGVRIYVYPNFLDISSLLSHVQNIHTQTLAHTPLMSFHDVVLQHNCTGIRHTSCYYEIRVCL